MKVPGDLYCWDIWLNLVGIVETSPGAADWHNQTIGTKLVLPGFCVTSKLVIFSYIVLIAMVEPNKLQKIQNHLERAESVVFFQMVVNFLDLIWFAQRDHAKNHWFWCDMSYTPKPGKTGFVPISWSRPTAGLGEVPTIPDKFKKMSQQYKSQGFFKSIIKTILN